MIISKSSWRIGEGGGHITPKEDDPEWKFHSYRGTNINYDMSCDPIILENEENEGDNISSNNLSNLKILTTNI